MASSSRDLRFADGIALLVEDDPDARRSMRRLLERIGFRVVEAGDPSEAERVARETEGLRLLVVDIIMPGLNGLALARRIASARPDVRILYVSGLTTGEVVRREEASPLREAFLEKPFTLDQLASRVRELLDG